MRGQLTCIGVVATTALAVAQTLPFRNYDVAAGLANSRVNCVHQDRRGYLWIGTWEGLSRFDGVDFVSYAMRDGLGSAYVTAIAEDSHDRLWIATSDASVALFEGGRASGSSFRRVRLPLEGRSDYARCLLGDAHGGLWCGTNHGLFRAQVDGRGEIRFEEFVADAPVSWPQAALALDDGRLLFGAKDAVLEIVGERVTRHPVPANDLGDLTSLTLGENGVWLVAFDRALYELDTAHGGDDWRRIPLALGPNQPIRCMLRDRDGDLWIGTWFGLMCKKADGTTILDRGNGLNDDSIRALCQDTDGNIWVGTWSGGLDRLATKSIVSWTTENGLADRTTLYLFEDRDGRMVVSSRGSIAVIESNRARVVPGSDALPWSVIQAPLLQDARGDWWIATPSALYLVPGPDIDLSRARRIGATDGLPDGSPFGVMMKEPGGRMWIALASGDLFWITRAQAADEVRVERAQLDVTILQHEPPRWIERLASGDVWFFPYRSLARSHAGGACERMTLEPGKDTPDTRCGYEDKHGNLWIGTRYSGLWRTRDPGAATPRFERVGQNALASDAVWSIAEDARGRLYLGTGRGVDRFEPDTGRVLHIGTREGLAGEIISHCITDASGNIWVATSGGVSRIDPNAADPQAAAPPIWVTRVRVGGEEMALDPRGERAVDAGEHPSNENDVEIHFTSPCFRGAIAFQYRLDGVDERWSEKSEQRAVNYAHLGAGTYGFHVRAVQADGIESPWNAEVSFAIRPPFWRTAWFFAACVATSAVAGWSVHRARVRRLLALQRIRTQIATDIHDEMGAGLAQIAILTEVAKRDARGDARGHLETVANLSRSLRDSMSDIVWAIDPRRDHFADVVQRMRHVASNLLESEGLHVEFDAPSDDELARLVIAPDRRRHLLLVLKEALSNVARHAHASRVRVRIARDAGALHLTIADDGRGFDRASVRAGQGLESLERRARAMGGTLAIDSRPGAGTRIELHLPL